METYNCPQCQGGHFRVKDLITVERYREIGFRRDERTMSYGPILDPISVDHWFCVDCGHQLDAQEITAIKAVFRARGIAWVNFGGSEPS